MGRNGVIGVGECSYQGRRTADPHFGKLLQNQAGLIRWELGELSLEVVNQFRFPKSPEDRRQTSKPQRKTQEGNRFEHNVRSFFRMTFHRHKCRFLFGYERRPDASALPRKGRISITASRPGFECRGSYQS